MQQFMLVADLNEEFLRYIPYSEVEALKAELALGRKKPAAPEQESGPQKSN